MILITGGAGYIGSHVNKQLYEAGHKTLVLDDLSRGHKELVKWGEFIQGNISDRALLDKIFRSYPIKAVVHLAAFAYVAESVSKPSLYYHNNVGLTINLLMAMKDHGVNKIIFSSTCSTYGMTDKEIIDESVPQNPMNPYAQSKLMVEQIMKDSNQAYGLNFVVFRYFNVAGASADGSIGEWHEPEPHLIPLALDVAIGKKSHLNVFGNDYPTNDGTCIRDYIHVEDIAAAHCLAVTKILNVNNMSSFYNLGTAKGFSVFDIINQVKLVTNCDVKFKLCERRIGDPPKLVGSYALINQDWGWAPHRSDIQNTIETAWAWHKLKANYR
jgi:UDP-glucose 4-epimerase